MLDNWVRSLPEFGQGLVANAYVAVGTFFVLSGFVLARSYSTKPWNRDNFVRYSIARFARFYPVYLLSLVVIAPIAYEELVQSPGSQDVPNKAGIVLSYVFVTQGWVKDMPVFWNTPAWSLSCELFFYLWFPLIVLLARKTSTSRILILTTAAVAIPFIVRQGEAPAHWKPLLNFGDFVIGIAAAGVYDRLVRSKSRLVGHGYWIYVPASLLALLLTAKPHLIYHWVRLDSAMRPLNALILLGLALGGGITVRACSNSLILLLGKASYAMYILHIPLLWWYKRCWIYNSGLLPSAWAGAAYIAGVVVVAALVCRFFEEPVNDRLRDSLSARFAPGEKCERKKPSRDTFPEVRRQDRPVRTRTLEQLGLSHPLEPSLETDQGR